MPAAPANRRKEISEHQLTQACLDQLAFFYGDDAYSAQNCHIKDWAQDRFSTSEYDINEVSKHPEFNRTGLEQELQTLKLHLAGSEFARHDPGYLEGSLDAAEHAIEQINNNVSPIAI
tara:strand:- start:25940 stop:26293 length:354 start_codon:yes stop_codon:yes gene_type:complete